jgi:hypothetical protein
MPVSNTYTKVLKSYEENQKVQILRKIRGARAFKAVAEASSAPPTWLTSFTDAQKKSARGFLYVRRLRTSHRYGFKLVAQKGEEDVIIGQEVPETAGEALLALFSSHR